jgi:PAP2 superfamily
VIAVAAISIGHSKGATLRATPAQNGPAQRALQREAAMKQSDNRARRRLTLGLTGWALWPGVAWAEDRTGGVRDQLGPLFNPERGSSDGAPRHSRRHWTGSASAVRRWNEVAIDSSGIDHTPVAAGETRVFGEQLGPCRSARAMAIVHIAIFDAVNAIAGGHESYTGLTRAAQQVSLDAAVAQAAHDTLAALFPSQAASLADLLAEDLAQLRAVSPDAKAAGIELGREAAAAILALRADDGSQHAEPRMGAGYIPSTLPGQWRQDPVSLIPLAMGARWAEVKPFVLRSAQQFRLPPPPAMTSAEYTTAFDEIKRLGGDGITTPTVRTEEQKMLAIFWAYDGTPSLCAPPRLYNQIAVQIAEQKRSDVMQTARLLALANVAMADAAIAAWDSKYHYSLWRPVTGVREADAGSGATGAGDGNAATVGNAAFMPLGAPASNLNGPNFTPPFPSYPSGHAVFGGALFQTLRQFYGTDRIAFTFVSDEFNGVTRDNSGQVRALSPRSFSTLSQAEIENGRSRIYLGIHWDFDCTQGIAQGRAVADFVMRHTFEPADRPPR